MFIPTIDCEYSRLIESINVKKWNEVLETLIVEGSD